MKIKLNKNNQGFSLIEILVAAFVLSVLALSIVGMFQFALKVIVDNKARAGAIAIVNEVIETTKNLPYKDIGTVGGVVPGPIPQSDTVDLNNIDYTIITSVTYIDDPFDGTVALGTDSLGNDYKKLKISASWVGHFGTKEVFGVTNIAPRGIETNEGSGILWINVINANGQPVPEASLHIINNNVSPAIDDSSQETNEEGYFYSSVPASSGSYQIVVTKTGYSSDYNCAIDPVGTTCSSSEGNPNPVKPRETVIEGQLTEVTFIIDQLSTLNISTVSQVNLPAEWIINTDLSGEDQRNPAMILGPDGKFYFSWQDERNSAARIYGQSYINQTAQWDPDLAITTSNNQDGPDLAVDAFGNLYIVWHDDKNGNQDIYFNKYDSTGNELWGGSKKLNTDAGNADQVYPKVETSATTTTSIEFVAWKDDRAGGGNSDIYMQKYDGAGVTQWGSELKVNFSSSSLFQAGDTTTWNFSVPSNYICDSGNCDGDADIEITLNKARLVPVQTCQGTSSTCDTFGTQSLCNSQAGCNWDTAGPCEDGSCQCSGITDEVTCDASSSCSWKAGAEGCSGACDCWDIGNRGRCQSVAGCAWWVWFCYPTTGCNCGDISQQNTCENASCSWESSGGDCQGSCSCTDISTELVCSDVSCSWDTAGPCSGTANACDSLVSQNSCEDQDGCIWAESGSGYPTDGPDIYPVQPLQVENIISWDSFSETATKNGGEIYYQLSDNNGQTWKYWGGSSWTTAGTGDYNTATVVNSNIVNFSISKKEITFRAFFVSNGNQEIILDNVSIGYTHTSDGGDYSRSVDMTVDANDNVYIAWETYGGTDYDVFIQKVDTTGSIVWANDVLANTYSAQDQTNPVIISTDSGTTYIAWQDERSGANRIYMQKYDTDGNNLWTTNDVKVTRGDTGEQETPEIVMDSSENIYIVWSDTRNGTNDIYIQKVDSSGTIQWTNDIRVNSDTTGNQVNPDVLIDGSGNIIVAWQDNINGDYDIKAAKFNGDPSTITPIGNVPITITGEKRVGSSPIIYKYSQNHITDGNGNLTLADIEWDTYNVVLQDGSGYTIFNSEPPIPFSINPAETLNLTLTLE